MKLPATNTLWQTQIINHDPKDDNVDTKERQACSIYAWKESTIAQEL